MQVNRGSWNPMLLPGHVVVTVVLCSLYVVAIYVVHDVHCRQRRRQDRNHALMKSYKCLLIRLHAIDIRYIIIINLLRIEN